MNRFTLHFLLIYPLNPWLALRLKLWCKGSVGGENLDPFFRPFLVEMVSTSFGTFVQVPQGAENGRNSKFIELFVKTVIG